MWLTASALAALASVGACATVGQPSPAPGSVSSEAGDPARYAHDLEESVDAAREDSGLAALDHDACAAEAARRRAAALVGADELEHAPLDDVLVACDAARAGENLSRSDRPPSEVVEAWLASAGHASNIHDGGFDRGAVACVIDAEASGTPLQLCSHVFLGP